MKTNELTGAALDWAVAKLNQDWTDEDILANLQEDDDGGFYSPSTNWSQGGPIIEWERICIDIGHDGVWLAYTKQNYQDAKEFMHAGPTPLIAAMRCYVATTLGDEVEVPKDL